MTIITLLDPLRKTRLPYISKVGTSASPRLGKRNNNNSNNYDIFVVCGSCHSSKAFSRKHNAYLCPFCDKGGEELIFPIQEEIKEELEGKRNLDLPDLSVRYSTTDGKTLDKPTTYNDTSARSSSGRDNNNNAKAIYQITNNGSRTRRNQKSDFERVCERVDQNLLEKRGITITSDEIIRDKSTNVWSRDELWANEKGEINALRRRGMRSW